MFLALNIFKNRSFMKKIKFNHNKINFKWIAFFIWLLILSGYKLNHINHIAWLFLGWASGTYVFYQFIINNFDRLWKHWGYNPPYSRYPKNFSEFVYLMIYMILFLTSLYAPIFLMIIK